MDGWIDRWMDRSVSVRGAIERRGEERRGEERRESYIRGEWERR